MKRRNGPFRAMWRRTVPDDPNSAVTKIRCRIGRFRPVSAVPFPGRRRLHGAATTSPSTARGRVGARGSSRVGRCPSCVRRVPPLHVCPPRCTTRPRRPSTPLRGTECAKRPTGRTGKGPARRPRREPGVGGRRWARPPHSCLGRAALNRTDARAQIRPRRGHRHRRLILGTESDEDLARRLSRPV